MATFTRAEILEGLQRLGELAQEQGIIVQLTLMGGAVMVLAFEARLSTRDELWNRVEPYLVPGDELTAQYAFLDLWESMYGTD
jgi:hypothetical protein